MRSLRFGLWLAFACSASMSALHCGDDGGTNGTITTSNDGGGGTGKPSDAAPGTDGEPSHDASVVDAADASVQLTCSQSSAVTVASVPRNDAGKLVGWGGRMRLVRLGPQLARAVVQRDDGSPEVLSFDPSEAQPAATSTALPFDVILDTAHEDGALYVYGLRLGIAADGGPTDQTALFLASIDDATGTLTTRPLTSPGAVATPKTYQYEPPLGRFVRFGDDDVYFTYTEEVGFANNPTYRLSVGRATASSGPVTMTVAATADAHKFEGITANGIVHAGANVHVFMGGSVVSNDSDDFDSAAQWTLPHDGTVPANIQKRGHNPGLLAAGRDGSMFRFAFLEPATIFGDPRYFYFANADESSLGTFQESSTNLKFSNDTAKASSADSHMEGSQFLWFGPKHGFWFDTSSGQVRATFGPMNPSNGISVPITNGAVTLASAPTTTSGTLDALFAASDGDGTSLRFVELTCAE